MNTNGKKVRIIGVPMDLGQKHRGVDMGPSALRYAGLAEELAKLGFEIRDTGNINVPIRYSLPVSIPERKLTAISEACSAIYDATKEAVFQNEIPIILGGDHSMAIGSVGGVTHEEEVGLIWLDAHADFNTPNTSLTGNVHGMSLAVLLGQGDPDLVNIGRKGAKISAEKVVLVGIRELDNNEKKLVKKSGFKVYTMRDIDEFGVKNIMGQALKILKPLKRIHLSLDADALDPSIAPGVGTPSPGGLTYREAQLMMEIISDTGKLSSVDIVEINPILDKQNQTARVAVELAASLLGKSII
jgi:arginase